ncbi:MAG: rhodanese-like domain-containing protein [Firmicutes bacterium]|nr:rhodanese-like domain-containing protein [Bacillota bacterium]
MTNQKYLLIVLISLLIPAIVACSSGSSESSIYKDITAEQLKEMMDSEEDVMLVDVRTSEEYISGHIAGSVLHPVEDISDWAKELDQEQAVILICRSGNRSSSAAQYLTEHGFTNVMNLVGGISAWPYGLVEDVQLSTAA